MRLVRLLAASAVLALPAVAHAAMTYVPDTGTTARSRGGAFTAAANDPMAIVYNPAGFADQKGKQVYIDITALQLNSSFARASDSDGSYKKVSNSGATKVSPNLIYSMSFLEGDKLNWHIGTYGAIGVNSKYPASGPQHYTTTFLEPQQLSYSTGVAYRINDMFAVGATVGGMYITNKTEVDVTLQNTGDPQAENSPNGTVHAVLEVANPFTPTGNIGVKITPVQGIEVGLSYRPASTARLDGTYTAYFLDGPSAGDEADKEDTYLIIPLPQILRTGVRKVGTGWDVELDLVLEDWSGRKKDVIDPYEGTGNGQLGAFRKIEVDRDGGPAFSVRLGGSYSVKENLQVHSGVLHETSAIPQERMSVNLFDAPKTGLGLGTTYGFSRFEVSGNLAYLMLHTQKITDSKVRQRSSLTEDPNALKVVGNGTYSGAYMFGGIAFKAKF